MKPVIRIFLLVLMVAGCKDPGPGRQVPAEKIRVGVLNGPAAVSIIRMMESGKLQNGEMPVEFIIRSEPSQIKSLMFREEIDFAFLPSTTAAILYNSGFSYKAVAVPLWGTMYLVGDDSTIRSVKDLRGKTISQMGRGVVPDIVLRHILKENGLDPDKDVKIDYSFPSHIELASTVKAGVARSGILSEPQVSMIINQNPNLKVLLDLAREWKLVTGDSIPFAQTVLMVGNSFSKNNPLLVKEFLENYKQNIEWINLNPAAAASLIVKHKVIPDSLAAEACIPRSNLRYVSASDEMEGIMAFYRVIFNLNKDAVGGKLPDEDFFYTK